MINKSIGFIGGGRITNIFLNAFSRKRILLRNIYICDPDENKIERIKKRFPLVKIEHLNKELAYRCDIIFLALHPPVLRDVLNEIKDKIKDDSIIVSLAPIVKIAEIKEKLGGFNRICRMIPNAPSLLNLGFNPICFSEDIDETEKQKLMNIFKILGECPIVSENKLESYAILTGMGPTYFWFQFNILENLGKEMGLSQNEVKLALYKMLQGSIECYFNSGLSYEEVNDLIPFKPLRDFESEIEKIYKSKLMDLYKKLAGK